MITIPAVLIDDPKEYEKEYLINFNDYQIAILEEKGEYNRTVLQEAWDARPTKELPVNFQPCAGSFTVIKDERGNFRLKF